MGAAGPEMPQKLGSPPHTRGHVQGAGRHQSNKRITPAYAGTCQSKYQNIPNPKDHPRIRGDMSSTWRRLCPGMGSPPHTRGHASIADLIRSESRITPAYAGTCLHIGDGAASCRDHPRIRRAMEGRVGRGRRSRGSPPHTRGHESRSSPWTTSSRITPAYAGTCMDIWARVWRYTDHPRIRGDMFGHRHCTTGGLGSPPHTRGHVAAMKLSSQPVRITPAYAGTCQRLSGLSLSFRDHPRIRGDMKP